MRDLGQMGENSVQLWCSQVGLTANGSRIDKTGWDFVIEFPFQNFIGPARVHEAAIECKVQVKATDNRDRKWQIKLSNLRRLITAPMPAFILILEFDGKKAAQRAIRHAWLSPRPAQRAGARRRIAAVAERSLASCRSTLNRCLAVHGMRPGA